MPENPVVLIVDDDGAHRLMLRSLLPQWGLATAEVTSGEEALAFVRNQAPHVVLMDLRMPGMDGIEATRAIRAADSGVPILIMTAHSSVSSAVEALKSGAYDYLIKPLDFDALRLALNRTLEHTRLRRENEELRRELTLRNAPGIISASDAMRRVLDMVALVAPTEATVLLTGESGTGKSLIARAIHAGSPRHDRPLVEVNCAAIPETLIESELFGHEKGAFTGAVKKREGRFSQAHTGSIFLDEVAELPLPMQSRLLRVLQEGEIQRVGSDAVIRVDARVIAATNRHLEKMVADGAFRQDLYYRLNVIAIEIPPLRDHPEDIPLLAAEFSRRFAEKNRTTVKGITPRAMEALTRHTWPGNVRELENVIERAVILLRGDHIGLAELPLTLQALAANPCAPAAPPQNPDSPPTLAEVERAAILSTLAETAGNKSEAARRLGVTRRTLHLKLKRYAEESVLPPEWAEEEE